MAGCCTSVCDFIVEYDTPRIVLIKNRKVGVVNRVVQLAILAYVIGWVLVWEKGYQEFDSTIGSVTTKVKGIAITNSTPLEEHIWDAADYVIPSQEENSFFVMTNVILTKNQVQGRCPELPNERTRCKSDIDCASGYYNIHSNGVLTGKCVKYNEEVKTCEIFAWCPVENDTVIPKPAILGAAENFTVLIKNNIAFPKFNFSKRNILTNVSASYLKSCQFNRKNDPFCPIFRLGDMVQEAGQDFQKLAVQGGVMGILIEWNCNLDQPPSKCVPKYVFRRLDNKNFGETISPGFNFRFAKYFRNTNGTETRTLFKTYGIRFEIELFGHAGKFNIIPTMINIGSGLALLGMKSNYYKEKKYKYVEDYELGIESETSYGATQNSGTTN
ncbi:P2X purinoceptor 4-like isoform X2 [Carcharodon carcharias]|uniref:P2X purinoceptor 4-like isoform X2 n=1 Tax=Carcharodon carcharias TaxID=13397 RepID=UPI001B7F0980|nr:P2X purinoceptor 4-like isoform X2 [Carcharodon carcharias]